MAVVRGEFNTACVLQHESACHPQEEKENEEKEKDATKRKVDGIQNTREKNLAQSMFSVYALYDILNIAVRFYQYTHSYNKITQAATRKVNPIARFGLHFGLRAYSFWYFRSNSSSNTVENF